MKFKCDLEIPYYDCNKYGDVTATAILKYLGETSLKHSDYIGWNFDRLVSRGYGWILNRWKVEIKDYPKARERITIETWTSRFYKFYANREFIIYDSNNNIIGKASTVWIFMNIKKGRPDRIPQDIYKDYDLIDEILFVYFDNFKDDISIDRSLDFRTRRSDIDYNNHVNNVKYLDWILEVVPEEVYKDYILREFEILYNQEVTYGDILKSQIGEGSKLDNSIEFIHRVQDKSSKSISTFAKTIWKKNKDIEV